MTGNANVATRTPHGWFVHLRQMPCHYFAIDGGSGAHLLAALAECNPYIRQTASPRHAEVLLVCEPVNQKLAPAVIELARSLPRPARVLIVSESGASHEHIAGTEPVPLEELLPGAYRIAAISVESVLEAILQPPQSSEYLNNDQPGIDETTIELPQKQEQEIGTELVVLSLGPVQSFTTGPLRLLLICDGEQVFSAQVEAGYAYRGIAQAMMQADWQKALHLAHRLDPLAPIASELAYVQAVEQLQGWQPPESLTRLREAALALERATNVLWWLVRFAHILADASLTTRSYSLATRFADCMSQCWRQEPSTWILPQYSISTPAVVEHSAIGQLRQIAAEVATLKRQLERYRLFALRTHGIGVLALERLEAAGVSGPVLLASKQGAGDVQSRLLARLDAAISDLHVAAETLVAGESAPAHTANWEVPAGTAHVVVRGPRGDIGLHLESTGGEQPARVEWQRPSAALLSLLAEMLAGQKLADAETMVASLDLAMAEVDG